LGFRASKLPLTRCEHYLGLFDTKLENLFSKGNSGIHTICMSGNTYIN